MRFLLEKEGNGDSSDCIIMDGDCVTPTLLVDSEDDPGLLMPSCDTVGLVSDCVSFVAGVPLEEGALLLILLLALLIEIGLQLEAPVLGGDWNVPLRTPRGEGIDEEVVALTATPSPVAAPAAAVVVAAPTVVTCLPHLLFM